MNSEFERRIQLGWHVSIRVDNIAYNIPDLVIYAGQDEAHTRAFFTDFSLWANQRTDVTKVMLNNGLGEVNCVYMTVPHVPERFKDNEMSCSACGATVYVSRVPENGAYRYWYNCKVCEHGENVEQVPEAIVAYLEAQERRDALCFADVFDGVEF